MNALEPNLQVVVSFVVAWFFFILISIRFQIASIVRGFGFFLFHPTHDFSIRDNCQSRWSLPFFLLWYIPTHWFRRVPDVYVFGVHKCGTSFLINSWKSHPQIYTSDLCKETHYFIGLSPFSCFFEKFDAIYRSFWPTIFTYLYNPNSICVEGTGSFFLWNEVTEGQIAKRILRLNPKAKFILILREPTSRTHSHFQMLKNNKSGDNYEKRTIGEAVRMEYESESIKKLTEKCRRAKSMSPIWDGIGVSHTDDDAKEFMKFRYLRTSFYDSQMKMLKKHVPEENIFVYKFEDMVQDPKSSMSEMFNFMGVKTVEVAEAPKNPTIRKKGETHLTTATREYMQKILKDDIVYYNFLQSGAKNVY